jgi:hypothetical protein
MTAYTRMEQICSIANSYTAGEAHETTRIKEILREVLGLWRDSISNEVNALEAHQRDLDLSQYEWWGKVPGGELAIETQDKMDEMGARMAILHQTVALLNSLCGKGKER